ncbi:MAG: alpha/beta fold hydrolase [Myxococcales bacterium]|nr:MAG: alpha/beta fold hydrolase [Myxococcales bacterium]
MDHRNPVGGERVEFPSRRGTALVGDLHRTGDRCGPTLILCHGMESTRRGHKQVAIVERFVPAGYSVLRFDFSYVGESEGSFGDITISGEVDDALGALDFLEGFSPPGCVLVGSSLGGSVALLAAAEAGSRVGAVATIAAVADAGLFTSGLTEEELVRWRATGARAWRGGAIRSSFLEDLARIDIGSAVAATAGPLLVMHGVEDDVVPPSHAALIERAAAGRARVEMFEGVGHRFEEPGALDALLATLEVWLRDAMPTRGGGRDG